MAENVYYSRSYRPGMCHHYEMTKVEVEDAKLAALLVHLIEGVNREQPIPGVSVPVCGADGKPLVYERPQSYGIVTQKTKLVPVTQLVELLMRHLGVEAYVDETEAYHPIKLRNKPDGAEPVKL